MRRNFYPRPPRGGRPGTDADTITFDIISIHALREEGDTSQRCAAAHREYFYPRPPRGGRLEFTFVYDPAMVISIHALREEGDATTPKRACRWANFYPRPPRGGRRKSRDSGNTILQFLSTPSARRATRTKVVGTGLNLFLSTPSARRATAVDARPVHPAGISIHALREEGDRSSSPRRARRINFYPRPPRGGRPGWHEHRLHYHGISIHALREEGDSPPSPSSTTARYFYPRPPRGGRRILLSVVVGEIGISIHALREEGDVTSAKPQRQNQPFLSTPSARRATLVHDHRHKSV